MPYLLAFALRFVRKTDLAVQEEGDLHPIGFGFPCKDILQRISNMLFMLLGFEVNNVDGQVENIGLARLIDGWREIVKAEMYPSDIVLLSLIQASARRPYEVSVNGSGPNCLVLAEMTGQVDFNQKKSLATSIKWSGSFPVKVDIKHFQMKGKKGNEENSLGNRITDSVPLSWGLPKTSVETP
nr:YTH domain-containing family protein 3 isoform X3 [Ipomoea batatas]